MMAGETLRQEHTNLESFYPSDDFLCHAELQRSAASAKCPAFVCAAVWPDAQSIAFSLRTSVRRICSGARVVMHVTFMRSFRFCHIIHAKLWETGCR